MELELLYEELRDPLARRLERLVGDARTAEDLRQEAFARAWASGPRDPEPGTTTSSLPPPTMPRTSGSCCCCASTPPDVAGASAPVAAAGAASGPRGLGA